ncbi:hypothetical protein [Blastochloris sulfoviridis]|uniref:Transglutaminase-like domain-containing protein n=1 Tax=Blastochloris sulfoviridis TaxID=50712 RepID=A0A5M6I165_9HYPH|nr:hypothetical protein [Blastochloris sulfoviridis]KAA5601924.1 hypothetical protein F1193_08350 [Blastochloris sulfoviridis]
MGWKIVRSVFILSLIVVVFLIITKIGIEIAALSKAATISKASSEISTDKDRLAIEMTRHIHASFVKSSQLPRYKSILYILSSRHIPQFFRVNQEAVDLLFPYGLCDSAARALIFLLESRGIDADQINIVDDTTGHSGVVAEIDGGRHIFLDPFFGVVPLQDGRIAGPEPVLTRSGRPMQWHAVAASGRADFYLEMHSPRFARQGDTLNIEVEVPIGAGEQMHIGTVDGSSKDVRRNSSHLKLTTFWDYLGSRYDRSWVRTMRFKNDAEITIFTINKMNKYFVKTNVDPINSGEKYINYRIRGGDSLIFYDGLAEIDWLSFSGYQEIDAILITGLPSGDGR